MKPPAADSFLQLAFRRLLDLSLETERRLAAERAAITRGEDPQRTLPAAVKDELEAALARQKIDARPAGYDPETVLFQQAQHLMARTVDAVLDPLPWDGDSVWPPLRESYPPADGVAAEFAAQIDELLEEDQPSADLVQLYLLALVSGVEAEEDSASRLLLVLSAQFPQLQAEPEHLFPAAYRRQQLRGRAQSIANARPWWIALGVALFLLLMTTLPLWWGGISDVFEAIAAIREHYTG